MDDLISLVIGLESHLILPLPEPEEPHFPYFSKTHSPHIPTLGSVFASVVKQNWATRLTWANFPTLQTRN